MIERGGWEGELGKLSGSFPVVGVVGARQVGKTTLVRAFAKRQKRPVTFFDLEDPTDLERLRDAKLALEGLRGLVVIDEVQHRPDLFPVLRVLSDRPRRPARFVVLGSASPNLLRQSSESLAGRIAYLELGGLSASEVGMKQADRRWLRGGFPRSFLAGSAQESLRWRQQFVQTFLQRDLPQLGVTLGASTLRRFWAMLAHYHGQIWNASEFGRSFGVADTTTRRYLDLLCDTFMVRTLQPWRENLAKRQVRAPKIYLGDTGILHALLGIATKRDLEGHPKVGASWEWLGLQETIARLGARSDECYFWATHAGAELDLFVCRGRTRLGIEVKRTSAPRATRSMHTALGDLRLQRIDIIYPGQETFPLAERIRAVPFSRIHDDLAPLR